MKKSSFQLINTPYIIGLDFKKSEITRTTGNTIELDIKLQGKTDIKEAEKKIEAYLDINLFPAKENQLSFSLKATIKAEFLWDDDCTEAEKTGFINASAPSIMLSYMRPVISNITTYAGLPPYIIPFLDLRKAKFMDEQKNNLD